MAISSFSQIPGGFGFSTTGLPGAQLGGRTGYSRQIGGGRAAQQQLQQSGELHQRRLQLLDQLLSAQGSVGGGEGGNPFAEGIAKIDASRRAEIEEGSQTALDNSLARLQDRGLGGSSFSLTAETGQERNKQAALSDLSGDIGALEIRGQAAALDLQAKQRQEQMKLLQSILGSVF